MGIFKKVAYSYSGYVGHICPFTRQLMAAGVDTHRAINIPMRAAIRLELTTGTLKVEAKQLATVTPQMTAVDLHHFHVKPFTTMKPNLFIDFVPRSCQSSHSRKEGIMLVDVLILLF